MNNSDLPNNNNNNNETNTNKPKRGRPKKVQACDDEINKIIVPEEEDKPKLITAIIQEKERTLDETVHEIMYNEIPINENEAKLTDTLLDIILNEPALKISIIKKIENSKAKRSTYTEANRIAQAKYRAKYPEKYKQLQKKVYERIQKDEDRKAKYNQLDKDSHKRVRDRKRDEKLARGEVVRPRGRPKKIKVEEVLKTGGDI